jgi:hypothetical protein
VFSHSTCESIRDFTVQWGLYTFTDWIWDHRGWIATALVSGILRLIAMIRRLHIPRDIKLILVTAAVVCVVVPIVGSALNHWESGSRDAGVSTPPGLSAVFSFEAITGHPEFSTVADGKKLAFNTHLINPAPRTPAYNAVGEQGIFLEPPPDQNGERLAGEAFDSQVRAKREDYLANKILNGAVIGNAPQWFTLETSDLTSAQVSDIISGHLTVYILLWQAWTDSPELSDQKRESCYCEFLQVPIPAQITEVEMQLWHACSCPAGFSSR